MHDIVLAIDPGRDKCGIAVVHKTNGIQTRQVVPAGRLGLVLAELVSSYSLDAIVLGDGTASREIRELLRREQPGLTVNLVDEAHSTEVARRRYWRENPPAGLRRLIPVTMQVPPVPVDDYVAVILAERYWASL